MDRLFPIPDHPVLNAFINDTHRFQVVAAGRRAYKSEIGKRKVVLAAADASKNWDIKLAMCAPTRQQAKAIFWQDLKDMVPRQLLAKEPSESSLFIKFLWGAEIHVTGLDKPQRLEGQPWDGFLFTETDDMKVSFWAEHLRPCLSDRNGWAIFEGVPNGLELLYEFSQRAGTMKDWSFHTWKSSLVLQPEEIRSVQDELDEKTFLQEYEASFQTPGGLVYYAFSDENIIEDTDITLADSVGIDFNVVPYLPGVVFYRLGESIYIVDEINLPDGNTPNLIQELQNRYDGRIKKAYPDPTGRARSTSAIAGTSDFTLLEQAGIKTYAKSRTLSVKDRITSANARFCSMSGKRNLFVDRRCKMLIDSLQRHSYKKDTSIPDSDNHVHRLDAMCYAVDYLFPIQRRQDWAQ